ncbi:MAG: S8 family serine peptidase [Gammaproteobacteria bacterium]|nr:S8 family serine peptidase [Gammaproteobacteria bacterium]
MGWKWGRVGALAPAGRRCALLVALAVAVVDCGGGGGGGGGAPANSTLSGTITVPQFVAVDSDTNDSAGAAPRGNNSPTNAQPVPNPVTIRGYVNEPGTGLAGPLQANGDPDDFYRVSLLAGQTVRLSISDHDANDLTRIDLDLLLVNSDNVIVDLSAGIGPKETLVVPESGDYLLVVTVCIDDLLSNPPANSLCGRGASNYFLSIGQAVQTASQAGALRLSADFLPNEALAEYALPAAAGQPRGRQAHVRFAARSPAARAVNPRRRARDDRLLTVREQDRAALETIARIRELQATPGVVWAEPNFRRRLQLEPSDPAYQFQWHYPLINLPAAWDITLGDPNVIVAVVDSGILSTHPDIAGQLIGGYDFVNDPDNAGDGDGIDPDPEDPGDGGNAGFSSSFHGTHVAGTVAASANNGIGVTGVAPDVRLMPLRAVGQDGGSTLDVRRAICYAAGLSGTPGCPAVAGVPANPTPVDIINLSLGGGSFSQTEQRAIDDIRAAGVTIVAAAGNESSSEPFYPAAYEGVVGVSAVTIQKALAPYSSFGDYIDIAAPGGDSSTDIDGDGYGDSVLSTGGDDTLQPPEFTYPFFQGTSMAAPHVAGVFALMKSVNGSLQPADFDRLLAQGALTDPTQPSPWNESFGFGLINAQKAVTAALLEPGGGVAPAAPPFLGATPRALNFAAGTDELVLQLRNTAGGDIDVISIASDAAWLAAPAAAGLGSYTLRVNRDGLDDGTYAATLTVVSSVNTLQLPVIMQVSTLGDSGDAGLLRVRLLNEATDVERDVTVAASNGEYRWTIADIPPGRYRLFAFSDADNDGEVCDPGEACGAYLTSDQPLVLDVQGSRSGLDFPVSFGIEAAAGQ